MRVPKPPRSGTQGVHTPGGGPQNIRAPHGNTKPDRRYLLAGLLRCGICERRMELCWSNNRAAYRCRHGHTSASRSDPDRPRNLYIREDRILPHLPALYMLLSGRQEPASASAPPTAAEIISRLRTRKITLTYNTEGRSLKTDTSPEAKIIIDHRADRRGAATST